MVTLINVTKTFLPPIEEYKKYIEKIWQSAWLTNQGSFLSELEQKLKSFLNVSNLQYVTNGTIALQLALKVFDIEEGEIITTPFSYVATTSSIIWERCTPVFVDIEPDNFTIDTQKIEEKITPKTKAIMPVHVFGYACGIEKIEEIAQKHNLKVIYDGAHAFGSIYKGKSLLSYGDISTCSFHATKLFHTVEGGACILKDPSLIQKLDLLKHFGHYGDDHISLGINAKQSEFHAAMGLCILPYIKDIIEKRKEISQIYDNLIDKKLIHPKKQEFLDYNYSYYPVVFQNECQMLKVFEELKKENIYPRRYFYPSLNKLPYVKGESCPVSEDISIRIACLPLYKELNVKDVEKISKIILKNI